MATYECDVYWLLNGFESAGGLALEEHVLDVCGGRVDEGVLLVEATRFDLGCLFLLIDDAEHAVKKVDASLGDDDAVRELRVPLYATDV